MEQYIPILLAVTNLMALMRESGALREATPLQPEEEFVPFNFSALDRKLAQEAKLPVAVPASSSEATPVGL